ncbi:hypothetical protein H6768_05590 [Candidatus Peribacteria bacterium]|nr:hypothetical protein [Candidatus Peribacteria bacterium]
MVQNARESILSQFDTRDEFIPIPIPEAITTLDVSLDADIAIGDHANKVTFVGK